MIETLRWLGVLLITAVRERRDLAFENLALRQQLRVLKRRNGVPRLKRKDRLFWVVLSRIWAPWRRALQLVKAETVVGWQRKAFRIYWARISRRKSGGRPQASSEVRALIKRMASANPYWGAPRIHGELLKLGVEISERTVSRLMPKYRKAPSPDLEVFPEQPRPGSGFDRFLHRSDCYLSGLVRLGGAGSSPSACGSL